MSRIKISLNLYLLQILIKIILIKTNKCVLITKVFVRGISITTQFLVGTLRIHLKLLLLIGSECRHCSLPNNVATDFL